MLSSIGLLAVNAELTGRINLEFPVKFEID